MHVSESTHEVGKCHLTLGMIQQFLGAAQEATECYSTVVKDRYTELLDHITSQRSAAYHNDDV